jgi:hypothetical protein
MQHTFMASQQQWQAPNPNLQQLQYQYPMPQHAELYRAWG